MAKNRNKKKKNSPGPMAMDASSPDHSAMDVPQAMDTSENNPFVDGALRKVKAGRQMKRSKNTRKMKAIAKAISRHEKCEVKITKSESKTLRTKSAKNLYE